MLDVLRARLREHGTAGVTPVLGFPDDPLVPEGAFDLVLMVNAFHHVRDRAAYLARIRRLLRPGGRFVNIDFHDAELPVGPPPEHKLSRAAFLALAPAAGLSVAGENELLPYQYFVTLRAAPAGGG
jgi:ubiquinone/menaquinone biosynthesis C-methylase UbiE